jgi:hypothetical protein
MALFFMVKPPIFTMFGRHVFASDDAWRWSCFSCNFNANLADFITGDTGKLGVVD